MTQSYGNTGEKVLVAIDIAKKRNAVLIQFPDESRKKYENYIKADPDNPDLKRKAYTAIAAKMARVAYALVKTERDYRCLFESSIPSGKIPSVGPLRHL